MCPALQRGKRKSSSRGAGGMSRPPTRIDISRGIPRPKRPRHIPTVPYPKKGVWAELLPHEKIAKLFAPGKAGYNKRGEKVRRLGLTYPGIESKRARETVLRAGNKIYNPVAAVKALANYIDIIDMILVEIPAVRSNTIEKQRRGCEEAVAQNINKLVDDLKSSPSYQADAVACFGGSSLRLAIKHLLYSLPTRATADFKIDQFKQAIVKARESIKEVVQKTSLSHKTEPALQMLGQGFQQAAEEARRNISSNKAKLFGERLEGIRKLVTEGAGVEKYSKEALQVAESFASRLPGLMRGAKAEDRKKLHSELLKVASDIYEKTSGDKNMLNVIHKGFFGLAASVSRLPPGFGKNKRFGVLINGIKQIEELLTESVGKDKHIPPKVEKVLTGALRNAGTSYGGKRKAAVAASAMAAYYELYVKFVGKHMELLGSLLGAEKTGRAPAVIKNTFEKINRDYREITNSSIGYERGALDCFMGGLGLVSEIMHHPTSIKAPTNFHKDGRRQLQGTIKAVVNAPKYKGYANYALTALKSSYPLTETLLKDHKAPNPGKTFEGILKTAQDNIIKVIDGTAAAGYAPHSLALLGDSFGYLYNTITKVPRSEQMGVIEKSLEKVSDKILETLPGAKKEGISGMELAKLRKDLQKTIQETAAGHSHKRRISQRF